MRQYIGARYVPKIYQNSQDPSSMEWENTEYEPFIIVSYLNNSYISRDQVPVNAGNPTQATSHWALFGYASGQIAHLQDEIDVLTTSKNIQERKKILILSDSYGGNFGTMTRNFLDLVKANLEDENITCDILHANGASFVRTGFLFESLLSAYAGDKDSITDLYVFGGLNDANYPLVGLADIPLATGIANFMTTAKTLYPNAVIHYGFIGRGARPNSGTLRLNIIKTIGDIQTEWAKNGGQFISNCEYILADARLMQSDGLHPNDNGADMLAKYVFNAILNGTVDVHHFNMITGSDHTVYETIDNGLYQITMNATITLDTPENIYYSAPHAISISSMTHDLSRTFGWCRDVMTASFDTVWMEGAFTIGDDQLMISPYSKTAVAVNSTISIVAAKFACNSLLIG